MTKSRLWAYDDEFCILNTKVYATDILVIIKGVILLTALAHHNQLLLAYLLGLVARLLYPHTFNGHN